MGTDYTGRDRMTGRPLPGSNLAGGNKFARAQQAFKKAMVNWGHGIPTLESTPHMQSSGALDRMHSRRSKELRSLWH